MIFDQNQVEESILHR